MIRPGVLFITASLFAGLSFAGESVTGTGVPVNVPVTVKGQSAALTADDLLVSQNRRRVQVLGFEPLKVQDGLQLWILIDDGSNTNLGTQLADLKRFALAQPAATQIGVGYLRNGMVVQVQPLTFDHNLVAKSMRLPTGTAGISGSPYLALVDLFHKWPAGPAAREVVMVSSGIDPDYGPGPDDPYLDRAIDAAQRAGVVVYSIYYSSAGRLAHAYGQLFWGQHNLARLGDETGGDLYWMGSENPVSIAPYLDDVGHRLNNQFTLTFLAAPEAKSGFQSVKIGTERRNVRITSPAKVYVPAGN
jgi:hypothetical protein